MKIEYVSFGKTDFEREREGGKGGKARKNSSLVYVFALNYGSMTLRLRSIHPSRLIHVLSGLGIKVRSSLGLIPVVEVPMLRLAEIVVMLFGKHLTILNGLNGMVIVILWCVGCVSYS